MKLHWKGIRPSTTELNITPIICLGKPLDKKYGNSSRLELKSGVVKAMVPETAKLKIEEQSREELQERQLVENPNKVIEVYADHCENCDHNLLDQVPVQVICRQITELPEIKPVVIETRQQYEALCPSCGKLQRGKLPEGLEAGRYFGPRLEAVVTDLHHEHHVGFKRLLKICEELFGLTLSAGGAVLIVERAGKAAQAEADRKFPF